MNKSARKLQVHQLPIFLVPRFGRVEFIPTGDVPLRQTNVWKVICHHSSPGRENLPPHTTWYPADYAGGRTPYPTAKIALCKMLLACAVADGLTPYHYYDADTIPPLRPVA